MRQVLRFLKCLNRLRRGHQPIFLEYEVEFKPRWTTTEGHPFISRLISEKSDSMSRNLFEMADYGSLVDGYQRGDLPCGRINWENHFIPALDGLSIAWAAKRANSRFVEIGSGNSTKFARGAIAHFRRDVRLISIDSCPRVEIDRLCDEIIRAPLENVDLSLFENLLVGDVVFVDNSHRSFMNSDVTVFFLDVLPRLKPGVLVGMHDIFLPHDYFAHWADRAYNEQYLLGCLLLANPNYLDIQLANAWISKRSLHVDPLKDIWKMLGAPVRDRMSSAFWAVKAGA